MALRGETIGTAYVRILADGDGFDESVREQFRDSEGGFKQLGRTHSEAYQEGFAEQDEDISKRLIAGLEAGIKRNAGRFDAVGKQIADNTFDPIDRQFKHRFKEVGVQMSKDIRTAFFRSGGASDVLDEFVERLEHNWEKASRVVDQETRQITKMVQAQADRLVEIEDERAKDIANIKRDEFQAAINRINAEVKLEEELTKKQKKTKAEQKRIERETQIELRKTESQFKSLTSTVDRFHRSLDADRATRRRLIRELDHLGERMRFLEGDTSDFERNFRRLRRELITTRPILTRVSNSFDRLGDGIGRAFGKGSRSEFLNIFGRIVGFMSSLPGLFTKAIQKVLDFGSKLRDAFADPAQSGFKFLASSLAQGVAGLVALAAVLGIVAVSAGILTSAIFSLIGAIVAMASTLAFALGGAVAVVGASLLPLIALIGVTVLAFQNMTKEMKSGFKDIKDAFGDLGEDAAENIFDSPIKDTEALTKAIKDLGVIINPVSKAIGGLLDEFIEDLNSPLWERFRRDLGRVLPDMVTALGHIAENLLNAIIGLFIALAPYTQRFLDWIEDVTGKFAKWVNSGRGKQSIEDFMDRAFRSAKKVGDLIGEIIGLIGDLFGVSNPTGNKLFAGLTQEIEGWRDSIANAREDGTLQAWFEDARQTTEEIGKAVVALANFLEDLDTPENRKLVRDIADGFVLLVAAIKLVGAVLRGVYNGIIGPTLGFMIDALAVALDIFGSLFDALGKVPGMGWAKKLGDDLHEAADAAHRTADAVKEIPKVWNVEINVAVVESNIAHIEERLDRLAHTRNVYYAAQTGNPNAGKGGTPRVAVGTPIGSPAVNVENMTIITPTEDPAAVASEVVNRFAAAAYA